MKLEQLHGNELSTKMQNLDDVIAKLSQERKPSSSQRQSGGPRRRDALLLVSEAANACVSLGDLEKEEERTGKVDLHQCGRCKSMFNNMSKFISHKLQKECRRGTETEENTWGTNDGGGGGGNRGRSSPAASPKDDPEDQENGDHEHKKRSSRKGYSSRRVKHDGDYEGECYDERDKLDGHSIHATRVNDFSTNTYPRQMHNGTQGSHRVDFNKQEFTLSMSNMVSHKGRPFSVNQMPPTSRTHQGQTPEYHHNSPFPDKLVAQNNGKRERIPIDLPQVMSTHGSASRQTENFANGRNGSDIRHPDQSRAPLNDDSRNHNSKSPIPIVRPYSNPGSREFNDGDAESQISRPYSASELTQSQRRNEGDHGRPQHEDRATPGEPSHQPESPLNNIQKISAKENTKGDGKNYVFSHSDKRTVSKHYVGQQLSGGSNLTTAYDAEESETPSQVARSSTDRSLSEGADEGEGDGSVASFLDPPYQSDEATVATEFEQLHVQDETGSQEDLSTLRSGAPDASSANRSSPQIIPIHRVKKEKPDYDRDRPILDEPAPEVSDISDVAISYTPDKTNIILPPDADPPRHEHDTSPLEGAPTFLDLSSPEKESSSPRDSNHGNENEDFPVESRAQIPELEIPPHRRLTESMVERLITVPVSGGTDASWKHSKQMYSCPLCAKVFPFKSKLQRHVLVHTGIKPYKCTVCGRGFTQQIDLQRHLTRHTGEKPFKCHLCTAQFIRADNLKKHCKESHYISIEEPIRKRRRKTTGSDTVLPSLEVAIALAFSETERNGGRVLGRAASRQNNPQDNSKQNNSSNSIQKGPFLADIPPLERAPPLGKYSTLPNPQNAVSQSSDPSWYSGHADFNGNYRKPSGKLGERYPGSGLDDRLPSQVDMRYGSNKPDNQYRMDSSLPYPRRRDDVTTDSSRYFSSSYPPRILNNSDNNNNNINNNNNNNKNNNLQPSNNRAKHDMFPPTLIEGEQLRQQTFRHHGNSSVDNNDDVFLRNEGDRYNRNPYGTNNHGRRLSTDQPDLTGRSYRRPEHFQSPPGYPASFTNPGHASEHSRTPLNSVISPTGYRDNAQRSSHSGSMVTEQPRGPAQEIKSGYSLEGHSFEGDSTTPTVLPSNQQQPPPLGQQQTTSRTINEWDSSFGFKTAQNAEFVMETDTENDIESSTEDQKTLTNDEFEHSKSTLNPGDREPNTEFSREPNNMYVDEEEIPIVTRSDDLPNLAQDM